MKTGLRAGIKVWLLGLAVSASLPLFLFSAYLIVEFGLRQQQSDMRELSQRAEATANAVSQRLGESAGYLSTLALSNAAQRNDIAALYASAQRVVQSNPDLSAISLVSPAGDLVFVTLQPLGTKNLEVSEPETVWRVFDSGKPVASGPFLMPSGGLGVAVGVPVQRNGKTVYCLRLMLRTDTLNALLAAQQMPSGWTSAIVDKNGVLLARSHLAQAYVGKKATQSLRDALINHTQGVFDSINKEGVTVKTVLVKVPGWDWSVGLGVPAQSLYASLTQAMTLLIGFGLVMAVVGVLLSVALASLITRQVGTVLRAAAALQRGEHVDASGAPIREFDDMVQQLGAVTQREQRTNLALRNVTARHAEVASALKAARRDPLTSLPGRALFLELADGLRQAQQAHGSGSGLALLYIDLDGFKIINDSLGHEQGDKVLMRTAGILRAMTRESDAAGRIGGDEFVLCLSADAQRVEDTACGVAARLVEQVRDIGFGVGCSIGIALWPPQCIDISCALRRADEAMYEAKRMGKGCYVLFGAQAKRDGTPWLASAVPGCSVHCLQQNLVA